MLWYYGHYKYFTLSVRGRLYTSEFDVYRRQILTYKDGPGAERVNISQKVHSVVWSGSADRTRHCLQRFSHVLFPIQWLQRRRLGLNRR